MKKKTIKKTILSLITQTTLKAMNEEIKTSSNHEHGLIVDTRDLNIDLLDFTVKNTNKDSSEHKTAKEELTRQKALAKDLRLRELESALREYRDKDEHAHYLVTIKNPKIIEEIKRNSPCLPFDLKASDLPVSDLPKQNPHDLITAKSTYNKGDGYQTFRAKPASSNENPKSSNATIQSPKISTNNEGDTNKKIYGQASSIEFETITGSQKEYDEFQNDNPNFEMSSYSEGDTMRITIHSSHSFLRKVN